MEAPAISQLVESKSLLSVKEKQIHIGWHTQYLGSVAVFALLAPPLLCSCILIWTYDKTEAVELPGPATLPPVATDMQATTNAQLISWTRPGDVRENPYASTYSGQLPRGWVLGETYKLTVHTKNDAAQWVDDALFEGVKKAGYNLERADSLSAAKTPLVITVDLIELSCGRVDYGTLWRIPSEKIRVRIRIIKSGQVLSDSTYEATSFEGRSIGYLEGPLDRLECNDADSVATLSQKALEKLLAKAVPSLLTVLHAATLPANTAAFAAHQPAQ